MLEPHGWEYFFIYIYFSYSLDGFFFLRFSQSIFFLKMQQEKDTFFNEKLSSSLNLFNANMNTQDPHVLYCSPPHARYLKNHFEN